MTTTFEETAAMSDAGSTSETSTARPGTEAFDEILRQTIGGMDAKQVFGQPIERDGVLFLPVAKVRGGGGAGGDNAGNGGGGFGLTAKPAGMYVIRNGTATWQPALDLNRVILGGQIVAIVALLVLRAFLKRRA
jgi:uncharacterized spore protein YtfJ